MKNKSRLMKNLSRLFITFVSSVFLVSFLILLTLKLTLFSENYIIKQAETAGYYSKLTTEINQQIVGSSLGSNIPEGILDTAINEEDVEKDVNNYFKSMYNLGSTYSLSSQKSIEDSVSQKIREYMLQKGIETTEASESAVTQLTNQAVTVYKGYVELPFLISYGQKVMNYQSKLVIFMIVCGVIWVILSICLYSSLKGYVHRLLRYWAYSYIGCGLMMIAFPLYILLSGTLKRIGIQSRAMYDFVQQYLSSFLWLFIIIGGISLIVGCIFAIASEVKRKYLFSS